MFDRLKEEWRMADGPNGICWPWSQWPSVGWMNPRIWGWLNCAASLTGAWGRPYIWFGPVMIVF